MMQLSRGDRHTLSFTLVLLAWLSACQPGTEGTPEGAQAELDQLGDRVLVDTVILGTGKASDFRGMTTPIAWAMLELVQDPQVNSDFLNDIVGLSPSASRNIILYRAGEDGVEGTEDDRVIDTLGELDAVPRVGEVTLADIAAYVEKHSQLQEVELWLGLPCTERRCLLVEGWHPLAHLEEAAQIAAQRLDVPEVALRRVLWQAPQPLRPRYAEPGRLLWRYVFAAPGEGTVDKVVQIEPGSRRVEVVEVEPFSASWLMSLDEVREAAPGGFPEAREGLDALYPEEFFSMGLMEAGPGGAPRFRFLDAASGHERVLGMAPDDASALTVPRAGQRCTEQQRDPSEDSLRLHFIDVGQGDAIWIQSPGGQNMLVDAGDGGFLGRANGGVIVTEYLKEHGLDAGGRIDALAITHAHADHFGGFNTVLRNFEVGAFMDPGLDRDGRTYNGILGRLEESVTQDHYYRPAIGDKGVIQTAGEKLDLLGPDVALYLMQGDQSQVTSRDDGTQVNNTSLVFRLEFAGRSVMLMGDAEEGAEWRLLDRYGDSSRGGRPPLWADLIKVGHHGSETSSSPEFLEAVLGEGEPRQRYAVIQSGRRSFGGTQLPALSTVLRLQEKVGPAALFSTEAGDFDKDSDRDAAGDDHILAVIQPDGHMYVCYP